MPEDLFSMNGPYARFMNWLWNLLVISVLAVVCCLPVFTAGAACTAAYYAMAKCVRHQTGKVFSSFFQSFRRNFSQAAVLTLILGLITAVALLECVYLFLEAAVPLGVLYLSYFLAAMVLACGCYVWPCLSRYEKSNFELVKLGIVLVFRHLISTVALLLLLFALEVGLYLMPWGIFLFPGLAVYLATFVLEPILLRYAPKPANADEAKKWYYQ